MITLSRLLELVRYNRKEGTLTWTEQASQKVRGKQVGSLDEAGYVVTTIDSEPVKVHQLIWFIEYGVWPTTMLDHKDRDKQNNRWQNLRESNSLQNALNTDIRRDNTSGVKGVTWNRRANKWQAQINRSGKCYYLGVFESLEEAKAVRETAFLKMFGEHL